MKTTKNGTPNKSFQSKHENESKNLLSYLISIPQ